MVALKRKELHLRSPCEYRFRSGLAWLASLIAVFVLLFVITLSFTVEFGDTDTQDLLKQWGLSLTLVVFTIEPINIMILASLPLLASEDSCIMRTYNRVYSFYSELMT